MDRFIRAYDSMDMVDIYSSGMMSKMRLAVIREMTGHQVKVIRYCQYWFTHLTRISKMCSK